MAIELTLDVIEQKKDLLFVAGIALTDIALGDRFTVLYQYGDKKKSKKQLSKIDLSVVSIIVDGEPVETVKANTAAMIALSGDFSNIEIQIDALRWRKKSGRFIRTSDIALTLADA